jgi:GAF domain-containing protein
MDQVRPQQQKTGSTQKAKVITLAAVISMLPVLVVGTASYYLGRQAIDEQITEARRAGATAQLEYTLARHQQLLLLLTTGAAAIALLSGFLTTILMRSALGSLAFNVTANEEASRRRRKERSQQLTDIIYRIRAYLDRDNILRTAVEETRRALNADRVVVYSVDRESKGVVIAESVDPRWPKALGKTIEDPCFESKYIKLYEDGRIRAIDNIYTAGMTQCYTDQLETLAVKANLVAPLLHENKLMGLFVVHQCAEPRLWEESEIDLLAQIATQVGFSLDNAALVKNNSQLQSQNDVENWWTDLFLDVSRRIQDSRTEEEVLDSAVKEIRRALTADRVLVYSLDQNSQGVVIAESVEPGWPRALGDLIEDPCFAVRYIEQYQNGRIRATDNIYEAGMTQCYIEQLEVLAVKANLVAPIIRNGKLLGILVAHQCSAPRAWKSAEIRWFSQIALQVGIALGSMGLLEHCRVLQQQVHSESRLSELFTDVTAQMHSSLSGEEVLSIAVQKVRNVLNCDRAVVYSMDRQSRGFIVAESVGVQWTRALGKIIEDPCFEARYLSLYEDGRVRALENIRESGMTPCYIEQLEKLEVKANLVAPVLHEGKLLGLLVAHQCSAPRAWTQLEIQWFTQIAIQVGFALDNAKLVETVGKLSQDAQVISLERLHEQGQLSALLEEASLQSQQTDEIAGVGDEMVTQILERMVAVQNNIQEASEKISSLGKFSPTLLQVMNFIHKLAAQMNQQAMNLTIRTGQAEEIDQAAIVAITETVCSSAEQLNVATTELETLIAEMDKGTHEASVAINVSTESIHHGTTQIQETLQHVHQLTTLSRNLGSLVGAISQTVTQGQSSTESSEQG